MILRFLKWKSFLIQKNNMGRPWLKGFDLGVISFAVLQKQRVFSRSCPRNLGVWTFPGPGVFDGGTTLLCCAGQHLSSQSAVGMSESPQHPPCAVLLDCAMRQRKIKHFLKVEYFLSTMSLSAYNPIVPQGTSINFDFLMEFVKICSHS